MVDDLATPNDLRPEDPPRQRVQWYAKGGKGFQVAALLLIVASLSACGFLVACLLKPSSGGGAETPKDAPDRLAIRPVSFRRPSHHHRRFDSGAQCR